MKKIGIAIIFILCSSTMALDMETSVNINFDDMSKISFGVHEKYKTEDFYGKIGATFDFADKNLGNTTIDDINYSTKTKSYDQYLFSTGFGKSIFEINLRAGFVKQKVSVNNFVYQNVVDQNSGVVYRSPTLKSFRKEFSIIKTVKQVELRVYGNNDKINPFIGIEISKVDGELANKYLNLGVNFSF